MLRELLEGLARVGYGEPPAPPAAPQPRARDIHGPRGGEAVRLGRVERTGENRVALLVSGHEALPAMLEAIAAAEHSVHLTAMVFFDDAAGRLLREALAERARHGVKVRVLFEQLTTAAGDPCFTKGISPTSVYALVDGMRDDGIDVRDASRYHLEVAHAPEAGVLLASLESWARMERRLTPGSFLDEVRAQQERVIARARAILHDERLRRAVDGYHALLDKLGPALATRLDPVRFVRQFLVHDHRKILVVDGRVGFVGGMNVGQEYLYRVPFDPAVPAADEAKRGGNPEPWLKWRDVHLRVEGPAVARLQRLFVGSWLECGGEVGDVDALFPPPEARGGATVTVLSTAPGAPDDIGEVLLAEIARAKTVRATNPYLVRDGVVGSLLGAARRGARVELQLAADENDSFIHEWVMRGAYGFYHDAGVELREYRNHFTHAKVAVFDDARALVGSYNFNNRSAHLDFECSLLVDDEALARDVAERVFAAPARDGTAAPVSSGVRELFDVDRILGAKTIVDLFPEVF